MANTYTLISAVTVGAGGAASIDFTSIPSTYTDLSLVTSAREDSTANLALYMRFNNDSAANYSSKSLQGNGGVATSFQESGQDKVNAILVDGNTYTANTFGNTSVYIPNYAGSSVKSFSTDSAIETNATTSYLRLNAGLWSGTSAINRLTLFLSSGNIAQYSTAYLYGVSNA